MSRRSILSPAERERLLAVPDTHDDLIRHYTLSEADLAIIRQRRGPANRLGFAVQLCYLRFPGIILGVTQAPLPPLLTLVADQLKVADAHWDALHNRSNDYQTPGTAAIWQAQQFFLLTQAHTLVAILPLRETVIAGPRRKNRHPWRGPSR